MKAVYLPPDDARTVHFIDATAIILQQACRRLAVRGQSARSALCFYTAQMRAIDTLTSELETISTNNSILAQEAVDRMSAFAIGMANFAQIFARQAEQQKMRLLRGWYGDEVVAEAFGIAAKSTPMDTVSQGALYEMLYFAIPGAGPQYSEENVVDVVRRVTALCSRVVNGTTAYTPIIAVARVALANLCDLVTEELGQARAPLSEIAPGTGIEAANARAHELRRIAARLLGIPKSAYVSCADHLKEWLKDPWIVQAAVGRQAKGIEEVIKGYEERTLEPGPFPRPALLGDATLRDFNILGLAQYTSTAAKLAKSDLSMAAAEFDRPLADNFDFTIRFTAADLNALVENLWRLASPAESLATAEATYTAGISQSVAGTPYILSPQGDSAVLGLDSGPNLPNKGAADPALSWPTTIWALRSLNLDKWKMYTREDVVTHMRERKYTPFFLEGKMTTGTIPMMPSPIPSLEDYDAGGPALIPSLENLARLWNQTAASMVKYLGSLRKHGADGVLLRAAAHALRFIGILNLGDSVIMPFSHHWYHCTNAARFQNDNEIVIVQAGDGSEALTLTPFIHIPESAILDDMPARLMKGTEDLPLNSTPLLRWARPEPGSATIPIKGWRLPMTDILDILILRQADRPEEFFLTGPTAEAGPLALRPLNAVVEVQATPTPGGLPMLPVEPGMYHNIPTPFQLTAKPPEGSTG